MPVPSFSMYNNPRGCPNRAAGKHDATGVSEADGRVKPEDDIYPGVGGVHQFQSENLYPHASDQLLGVGGRRPERHRRSPMSHRA